MKYSSNASRIKSRGGKKSCVVLTFDHHQQHGGDTSMMASTLDVRKVMLSILKSMYQDSRERRSTSAQIYRRAYRALQACPLPLQHPAETVQLDGFGETLATELEKRLVTYCREHGKTMPKRRKWYRPALTEY